ncbi:MAG TPA: AAA family ATPase [Blastocatellia bacterium]
MTDLDLPISFRSSIEDFTRDLTAAALHGQLEPVTCREREIERVITTLLRQSKNNPVLVGEAGVGKTAVVEGLAQQMASGNVPDSIRSARILSLSHVDLLAGASFRGQYEKRLQAVINQASNNADIILFIDELHNLIGAGSAIGAPMDAANMLKPALANGQLRVIGATTEREYNRYIGSDSALERRFQPIHVGELNREQTLEVLRGRQHRLEMHHLLAITDDALVAAADLSLEYLPDRKQPDRSIDLLDETCARVRLRAKPGSETIAAEKANRERVMAEERKAMDLIMAVAVAKGTPIERISRGTFKLLESVGLEVEKIFTGPTTSRRPLPPPESVRRMQEGDPAGRLAELHHERLRIEDRLRALLVEEGFQVRGTDVADTLRLDWRK